MPRPGCKLRLVAATLVALCLLPGSPARADKTADPTANQRADLAAAARAIDTIPGIDALLNTCPADLFETRDSWIEDLPNRYRTTESCSADVPACTQACVTGARGKACLYLGITLEQADLHPLSARRAHALACARGAPSGCTNRGGGIRNVPLLGDDQSNHWTDATRTCLFRTFDLACEAEDSWGCFMAAQTHDYGEGTAPDPATARRLYHKTCQIAADPTFEACTSAMQALDSLPP